MDYASFNTSSSSSGGEPEAGAGGTGFDYSQFVEAGEGAFDYSQFASDGPLAAAPLAVYFLLPASSSAYTGLWLVTWGVFGVWGTITNATCAVVLIKSKLTKSWTYNMLLNLCCSDFIFCLHAAVFRFPGVLLQR